MDSDPEMTISLTLHPQEEARLIAAAQARGMSPDALVREALDGLLNKILAEIPGSPAPKQPTRSLRGILAPYGPAPSAEEIDQNRAEMFAPSCLERCRELARLERYIEQ